MKKMSSAKGKLEIGPVEKTVDRADDVSENLFARRTRSKTAAAAASRKMVLPTKQTEEKESQTEEPMQVDEESLPTVFDIDKVKEFKGHLGDCIVM